MNALAKLKRSKIIYTLGHNLNLFRLKFRTIIYSGKYLFADQLKIHRNDESGIVYLIFRNVGYTGLMTHMLTVLGWIDYAKRNGYTLIVDTSTGINQYRTGMENTWEMYYKQPMVDYSVEKSFVEEIMHKNNYILCPDSVRYHYMYIRSTPRLLLKLFPPHILFPMPYDIQKRPQLHKRYESLYKEHIHFTPEVEEYVQYEYDKLLKHSGTVLGVLLRGTDYLERKPYMHYKQPDIKDVFAKIDGFRDLYHWDYIYLATEDEYYDWALRDRYPGRILINERVYTRHIGQHEDKRKYYAGMEYLSSMYLLSKCDYLIAGLCGGSQAAVLMNQHQYKDIYLFDVGLYL